MKWFEVQVKDEYLTKKSSKMLMMSIMFENMMLFCDVPSHRKTFSFCFANFKPLSKTFPLGLILFIKKISSSNNLFILFFNHRKKLNCQKCQIRFALSWFNRCGFSNFQINSKVTKKKKVYRVNLQWNGTFYFFKKKFIHSFSKLLPCQTFIS